MDENRKLTDGLAFPNKSKFESFVFFCSFSTNNSESIAEYKFKNKTSETEANFEQHCYFTF